MTDIYFENDVELGILEGKTIAALGYGNQGRSQALNFRDLGLNLVVGNREDEYREQAIADGFEPVSLFEAAEQGDVLLMLTPDEVQPEIYERDIAPSLTYEEKQATVRDLLKSRSGVYHEAAAETQEAKDLRPQRGSHPAPGQCR